MLDTIYATKKGMSQVWDKNGKRWPVTKFLVEPNIVLDSREVDVKADKSDGASWEKARILEIGYGAKKLKNMRRPQRVRLEKLSLTTGVKEINAVRVAVTDEVKVGDRLSMADILKEGDIVAVQGTTKGKGFAGGMKRHGFRGGPKTHGQADRWRAVGSVGNRTTPGRVWLGKRLPGHMGVVTKTVKGLVVVYVNPETNELWLTGVVPGGCNGVVSIKATGKTKKDFALDKKASGLIVDRPEVVADASRQTVDDQSKTVNADTDSAGEAK